MYLTVLTQAPNREVWGGDQGPVLRFHNLVFEIPRFVVGVWYDIAQQQVWLIVWIASVVLLVLAENNGPDYRVPDVLLLLVSSRFGNDFETN